MRETLKATGILERAIVAFENATGLHAEAQAEHWDHLGSPKALLNVFVDERRVRFTAEIKVLDRLQAMGTIKARENLVPFPSLLVAPYVTEATAE